MPFIFRAPRTVVRKVRRPSAHEQVIDRLAPKMDRAFREAALRAQGRIDLAALEAAIEAGHKGQAARMAGDVVTSLSETLLTEIIVEAFVSSASSLGSKIKKGNGTIYDKHGNPFSVLHEEGSRTYEVFVTSDNQIGSLTVGYDRINAVAIGIDEEYQRRGLASALYDFVEADLGHKLQPYGTQSAEGKAFWDARRAAKPTTIAGHLALDVTNPRALAAAERQAAELLTAVNVETKTIVRDLIARAYREQITSYNTARLIRDVVGLNARQATALFNFRAGLVEDGVKPAKVDLQAARYADRLLRDRAKTIAQTEIHRASAEGQHELWREGVREGRIPATAVRIWIANEGACDWCEGIEELNADGVPIDGQFETPDGDMIDGPEDSHVGCRCSSGLDMEGKGEGAEEG